MEEKNKISKSTKLYLVVAFIVLISIIIYLNPNIKESFLDIGNSLNKVEKELELVSEFNIDKSLENIDIYDKKIIKWNEDTLSFLDFNGFEVNKEQVNFENPDIYISEENIYLIDKATGKISILNKKGEKTASLDLKSKVYNIKEKNARIYIHKKNGDEEIVEVVDKKGTVALSHTENIPILTLDLKEDGKEYAISTLEIDKNLSSNLTVYNISGEKLFSKVIKDEVVIFSKFIKDDILLATEKSLYLIDKDGTKWEKKYSSLKDIKFKDDEIILLYEDKFEVVNLKGSSKVEIDLNNPLEKILAIDDELLLFGKRDIILPGKKKNLLNFSTDEDILDVKYDKDKLLILKEGKIEIYKIKEKGDN